MGICLGPVINHGGLGLLPPQGASSGRIPTSSPPVIHIIIAPTPQLLHLDLVVQIGGQPAGKPESLESDNPWLRIHRPPHRNNPGNVVLPPKILYSIWFLMTVLLYLWIRYITFIKFPVYYPEGVRPIVQALYTRIPTSRQGTEGDDAATA